jgi:hypothetical protein
VLQAERREALTNPRYARTRSGERYRASANTPHRVKQYVTLSDTALRCRQLVANAGGNHGAESPLSPFLMCSMILIWAA